MKKQLATLRPVSDTTRALFSTRGGALILMAVTLATLALWAPPRPNASTGHDLVTTVGRSVSVEIGPVDKGPDVPAAVKRGVQESYAKLPLSFEANQGQTDPKVQFLSRGSGYTFILMSTTGSQEPFTWRAA